jgi:hypothetical protein
MLAGSTLAKVWVVTTHCICLSGHGLRYGLRPPERVMLSTGSANREAACVGVGPLQGITELACGGQAFIATSLFDPSMSALPIIPKQNSVSVGLFTH